MAAGSTVSIQLLGPLRLQVAGSEVSAGPPRQQALLAFLATNAGAVVTRDQLIDAVWGETAPRSVTGMLHTYVSALRRILSDRANESESYSLLVARGSGYELDLDDDQLDTRQFERELTSAARLRASESPEEAIALWCAALRRSLGVPLAGIDAPFVEAERARLTTLRLAGITDLAETALEQGNDADTLTALAALEQAIEEQPLHERLAELRISILHAHGRRADALIQFKRTRGLLADRLGIEPSERLQDAYQRVLTGPATPAATTGQQRRTPAGSTRLPPRPAIFVGREAERTELTDRLAEIAVNRLLACAIDGPPGVGKTALAVEFAHQVEDHFPDGCHYLDLRGLHSTDSPMPVRAGLRTLIEILGAGAVNVPDGLEERIITYRSLLADKRALLILDDARDPKQVRPFLAAGNATMVVVTSRRRLGGLVARDGAARISLDVLAPDQSAELLIASLRHTRDGLDSSALAELTRLCGDLPLALTFAAEQLRAMPQPDVPGLVRWLQDRRTRLSRLATVNGSGRRWTVEDTCSWSLADLDTDSAQLFVHLGVRRADSITADTAAAVSGWSVTRARRALEELAMASLLSWGPLDRYDITPLLHDYAATLYRAKHSTD